MTNYEIMFIVRPTLSEEEIKGVSASFEKVLTDNGAKNVSVKELGQKELAYEINKFKTGYYYLFVVESDSSAVKEFDRVARINESLLRHLVVKVED